MKVKLYGTGSAGARKAKSACALIDGRIMFDLPNGSLKSLYADGVGCDAIELVIISHFHGDHDFDVPTFLFGYGAQAPNKTITIIAPKGATKRYKTLCKLSNFHCATPKIIEISPKNVGKTTTFGGYSITPYAVKHADLFALGYTITDQNGTTIGFGGDSAMCDGLHEIVKASQTAFIDVANIAPHPIYVGYHLDIAEYDALCKQYPNCKIIPVHMNDDTREELKKRKYPVPTDGETFEIKGAQK